MEANPDHDIGIITTTPEVVLDAPVPHTGVTAINPAITCHIEHTADFPCTKTHPYTTPEIEAVHICVHPTIHQDMIYIGHTCNPVDHKANHIAKGTPV